MAKKTEVKLINVALSEVWADWKRNPRGAGSMPSEADPASFKALVDNIRAVGCILQPIVTTEETGTGDDKGAKYRVMAGYRRLEALIDLAKEGGRFKDYKIPIVVRAPGLEFQTEGEATTDEEGNAIAGEPSIRLVSDATAEALIAASENELRQGVSAWDKISQVGTLARDGFSVQELCTLMSDNGSPINASTARNYVKIATLTVPVQKKLRGLGGLGYRIALKIIAAEYKLGGPTSNRWDSAKQLETIAAEIEALTAAKEAKKNGVKPVRWVMKPGDLKARFGELEGVAPEETLATLRFLVGDLDLPGLKAATDEEFANVLTGSSGPEGEEDGGEEGLEVERAA